VSYNPQTSSNQEKKGKEDEPVVSLSDCNAIAWFRHLFVEGKKKSVKISSRPYYHDTKFNWKKGKQH
jgi:hypothetical protein